MYLYTRTFFLRTRTQIHEDNYLRSPPTSIVNNYTNFDITACDSLLKKVCKWTDKFRNVKLEEDIDRMIGHGEIMSCHKPLYWKPNVKRAVT
jgi:hypothetical protein